MLKSFFIPQDFSQKGLLSIKFLLGFMGKHC